MQAAGAYGNGYGNGYAMDMWIWAIWCRFGCGCVVVAATVAVSCIHKDIHDFRLSPIWPLAVEWTRAACYLFYVATHAETHV